MIVRNEEVNIERALRSVIGVVDEIVVVDTGSEDKTVEIAKKYTEKVYFHEWKDDFSEARNFSLRFPTCEWVLILDADEELSEEFRKNIRTFLNGLSFSDDINTIFAPTINFLDFELKKKEIVSIPRIFRNGTVYYKNIVHNRPIFKPKVKTIPWAIYHYGYIWTRKLREKKYIRTGTLIKKHLSTVKSLEDKLYYLAQLYKIESIIGKEFEKFKIIREILSIIKDVKAIPTIVIEVLYYIAMDLMNHGYYDRAKEILMFNLQTEPDYPDTYYGFISYYERVQNWKAVIEWTDKFLKVLENVLNTDLITRWTVTSVKATGAACFVSSKASLKLGDGKSAQKWFIRGKQLSEKNGEDLKKYIEAIVKIIEDIDCKVFNEFVNDLIIGTILEDDIYRSKLYPKIYECRYHCKLSYKYYGSSTDLMEKLWYKRILNNTDQLLNLIINKEEFSCEELISLVNKHGPSFLIFVYDYMIEMNYDKKTRLRILSSMKKLAKEDNIKAIAMAFLGDEYLNAGKFQEAVLIYKKAIEASKEIIPFVKPVIEDLKIFLTTDLEGTFKEIYRYFSKNKELIFDVSKILDKETLQVLYLLSDSDYAKYVSALSIEDPDKAIESLNGIKNKEKFSFYYYRLAKMYEKKKEWGKAFELHIRACEENENLADIRHGVYKYHALYFEDKIPFNGEEEEIVWSGNISETFSNFDVISPVRLWKRSKDGVLYSIPFHSRDSIEIFVEKFYEANNSLSRVFSFDTDYIWRYLVKENLRSFEYVKNPFVKSEDIESKAKKYGLQIKTESPVLVVPEGLEVVLPKDFENIIHKYERVILAFFEPSSEKSLVWRFPPFKIIRTLLYLKEIFEKQRYVLRNYERIGKDAYLADFARSEV